MIHAHHRYFALATALLTLPLMTACPEPEQITYTCQQDTDCPGNLRCNATTLTCVELAQTCGDGVIQAHEECDPRSEQTYCDYGADKCQTCSASCVLEDTGDAPFCGDGVVQRGEEACDEGPNPEQRCEYGLTSCQVCSATCEFIDGQTSRCGDFEVDTSQGEQCDEGTEASQDCDYGLMSCTVCDNQCREVMGKTSLCGDGVVDAEMEECDAGEDPDLTCEYGLETCRVCNAMCKEQNGITSLCGDGNVDPQEDCDPGMEAIGLDCPYDEPDCMVCTAECDRIPGNDTGSCGDGIIQENFEQCDGDAGIASDTCQQTQNLSYGQAVCDTSCQIEASSCFGIVQLAAGDFHTCGLTQDGRVYCWGDNVLGQLGIGTNIGSSQPVELTTLSDIAQIESGSTHTCALTQTGEVSCWGNNSAGQLGIGSTLDTNSPTPVAGLPADVVEIASGAFHVCARTSTKDVYCWGDRRFGALTLDDSSTESVNAPIKTTFVGADQVVAGGFGTCAIKNDDVFCWGAILGGEFASPWLPTRISGASNLTQIALGFEHGCGVTPTNTVICWGDNPMGQLGNPNITSSRTQGVTVLGSGNNTVTPLNNITKVFVGAFTSCALSANDEVYCWGDNNQGALGIATSGPPELRAVSVPGLRNRQIEAIGLGFMHGCVATATGEVSCSGENMSGQLGIGATGAARLVHTPTTGW